MATDNPMAVRNCHQHFFEKIMKLGCVEFAIST